MRWNLKVYLKAFDVGLQDTFVYRWNFFLRSIFELLPLMGTVLIWGVVFDQRKEGVGGFDFTTVVAYFLIVLFLGSPLFHSKLFHLAVGSWAMAGGDMDSCDGGAVAVFYYDLDCAAGVLDVGDLNGRFYRLFV